MKQHLFFSLLFLSVSFSHLFAATINNKSKNDSVNFFNLYRDNLYIDFTNDVTRFTARVHEIEGIYSSSEQCATDEFRFLRTLPLSAIDLNSNDDMHNQFRALTDIVQNGLSNLSGEDFNIESWLEYAYIISNVQEKIIPGAAGPYIRFSGFGISKEELDKIDKENRKRKFQNELENSKKRLLSFLTFTLKNNIYSLPSHEINDVLQKIAKAAMLTDEEYQSFTNNIFVTNTGRLSDEESISEVEKFFEEEEKKRKNTQIKSFY